MPNNRLVIYTALQLPFSVDNDSSNQNTMEFTAVVLGLLLAWRTKLSDFHYDLHGDNGSSLAWAKSDRVNSVLARKANIILYQCIWTQTWPRQSIFQVFSIQCSMVCLAASRPRNYLWILCWCITQPLTMPWSSSCIYATLLIRYPTWLPILHCCNIVLACCCFDILERYSVDNIHGVAFVNVKYLWLRNVRSKVTRTYWHNPVSLQCKTVQHLFSVANI